MEMEGCNVKECLKSLIAIRKKLGILCSRDCNTEVTVEHKINDTKRERALWTVLLSTLNSPYVTSPKTGTPPFKGEELDGENRTYDELMREAFFLKMKGRARCGLRIEENAELLVSKRVNYLLVKFLLCLSNTEDTEINCQVVPDFSHRFSNCSEMFNDVQLEQKFSSWINIGGEKERERQERFFHFELASSVHSNSNIFQSKPGSHFGRHFSIQMPNDSKVGSTANLFGALSNQYHQDTLDMVLSLPDMSHDSLITKSKSMSIDEGFIDDTPSISSSKVLHSSHLHDDLQIWTDCLASDWQACHTWERLTRHWTEFKTSDTEIYLTESGPQGFDHLCSLRQNETVYVVNEIGQEKALSMDVLTRHTVNVLSGLPSEIFMFNKVKCCFVIEASICAPGLSSEAANATLEMFAEIGTYYKQLSRFTQHHSERSFGLSGGLTLESFVTSLRKYLNLYKYAVLVIQENMPMDFLKLWAIILAYGTQLRFLAEICLCSAAFGRSGNAPRPKFPVGLRLISYLYDLCIRNQATVHYSMLISLFKDTCVPFLRYISNWIFDGRCHDPFNEFLFDVDDQYLCYQDKHYWTHGYVLKENRNDVMIFEDNFIEKIYACGKALNLLRETNKCHYLLKNDLHPPQIELKLSAAGIEKIKTLCLAYETRAMEAKTKELNEKEFRINDVLQRKREEIAAEKEKHEKMLLDMNELERKVKEAVQMKKDKELQRLKEQMEMGIEKRKKEKEKQLLEDKEHLKQETIMKNQRDEAERKAREELMSYYDKLSKQAIARENRALWIIKRHELHKKRKEFILNEELRLNEEKDTFESNENEKIVSSIGERDRECEAKSGLFLRNEEDGVKFDDRVCELKIDVEARAEPTEINWEGSIENDDLAIDHNDIGPENDKGPYNSKESENSLEAEIDIGPDNDVEPDIDMGPDNNRKMEERSHSDLVATVEPYCRAKLRKEEKEGIQMESEIDPQVSINKNEKKSRRLWDAETVRSYEPKTVMQSLLYPDVFDKSFEIAVTSSRGKELKAVIKDLIYHQEVEAEQEIEMPAIPLTQSEVVYDITYEDQQENLEKMSSSPQPYLLDSFFNKSRVHENDEDGGMDAIKELPLEVILHRSLVVPISSQIKLVDDASIKYMLDSLQIEVHFDAFRKYLLLEDGEFGMSLCIQIFDKAFGGLLTPKEFCIPAVLNSIISQALQFSVFADKLELSRKLSFSLKFIPEFFNSTDINSLDFLQLRYKVPWPCNIIITENSIAKYNKVFSFLVKLKMVNWTLQKVWHYLKRAGRSDKSKLSPQIRKLHLFRHEMQHFVNNIERYLVNQIIHISWQEFQSDLKNNDKFTLLRIIYDTESHQCKQSPKVLIVHNIDDLHKYHVNYLNRIIFRSLLNKNAGPVLKIILDIFTLVLKFQYQLLSSDWKKNQDGFNEHPYFSSLSLLYDGFKQYSQFLFKVVSKLIRRGYQNHLDHLLLQVNFNGCYDCNTS